jgi:hypothetical protein
MSQSLELTMKYRPGRGSIKLRRFHYDGDGPCVSALHVSFGLVLLSISSLTSNKCLSGSIESPLRRVESLIRLVMSNAIGYSSRKDFEPTVKPPPRHPSAVHVACHFFYSFALASLYETSFASFSSFWQGLCCFLIHLGLRVSPLQVLPSRPPVCFGWRSTYFQNSL